MDSPIRDSLEIVNSANKSENLSSPPPIETPPSPWGKISHVEPIDFREIMSEDYARYLQDKENGKFFREQQDRSNLKNDNFETSKDPSTETNTALSVSDKIPERLMEELNLNASLNFNKYCESDRIIAEMLQVQYDREHDRDLKQLEKQQNKNSKISISYQKHMKLPVDIATFNDTDLIDDAADEKLYRDELDMANDDRRKNWDRFDANNRLFEAIPKKGFIYDEDGLMITKHDQNICGTRNACRIMSFPPEIETGDAAGFDFTLNNKVFNNLKTQVKRKTKNISKAHNRREDVETATMGLDSVTRLILYKLTKNDIIEKINGSISTGKEAIILHADMCTGSRINDNDHADGFIMDNKLLPKQCAIKVFSTTLNVFKQRDRYIKDDARFRDRFSKQNDRAVIHLWAEKEMHNLLRMRKYGINCPDVILLKKHVLLMTFIGDGTEPAPKLKEVQLNIAHLSSAYQQIIKIMKILYNDVKLIHADLSEYNILWHENKCWIIDVAQSVEPNHPGAIEFLMRDCENIINFFTKRGLTKIKTTGQLFKYITNMNPSVHNAAQLERIHIKGPSCSIATLPTTDEMPEHMKPITYPFEYAWETTVADKLKANGSSDDDDDVDDDDDNDNDNDEGKSDNVVENIDTNIKNNNDEEEVEFKINREMGTGDNNSDRNKYKEPHDCVTVIV